MWQIGRQTNPPPLRFWLSEPTQSGLGCGLKVLQNPNPAGVWMVVLCVQPLRFSISTSSSPAPHFAVHINYQWNICVLLPPTILSSLGSVQTWEHKYLYQLYTLSWIFISACWTSVFPLHSFTLLFLFFLRRPWTWLLWNCSSFGEFKVELCVKLKARGSLEYFVRASKKALRTKVRPTGVPQGAYADPLTVSFERIPDALQEQLQYFICDSAITHL